MPGWPRTLAICVQYWNRNLFSHETQRISDARAPGQGPDSYLSWEECMKRFLAVVTLVAALLAPGMAAAEGSGLYLAPKLLLSLQNTGDISKDNAPFSASMDRYDQLTLGGALAVGFDFWQYYLVPLRFELELGMRGNAEHEWDTSYAGRKGTVDGTWNSTTLFANLYYDIHTDSGLTPYLGGGLGMAFNYAEYKWRNGVAGGSASDTMTNFAWNLGAGVSYSFNENLAVDLAYRFVSLGHNEVTLGNMTFKNDPYDNEFMLGLRFGF